VVVLWIWLWTCMIDVKVKANEDVKVPEADEVVLEEDVVEEEEPCPEVKAVC